MKSSRSPASAASGSGITGGLGLDMAPRGSGERGILQHGPPAGNATGGLLAEARPRDFGPPRHARRRSLHDDQLLALALTADRQPREVQPRLHATAGVVAQVPVGAVASRHRLPLVELL